jgi:hypothetical protein
MRTPLPKPRRAARPALPLPLPAQPVLMLLALLLASLLAWAAPCRAQSAAAQPAATPAQPAATPAQPAAAPAVPQAVPAPAAAEPPAAEEPGSRVWQATWEALHGQSIVLGGGYTQGTLKFPRFRGDPGAQPQITDNGALTLLLQYETSEQYFATFPLQSGQAAFGYNFVASYAGLDVNRQLHGNAFQGEALGSAVKGDYLVAAPLVFVRVGPLYPDRHVFWKFGVGVGAALVRLHGQVLPYGGDQGEALEPVDSKGTVLTLYDTFTWELELERWLIAFKSLFLGGKADQDRFTYEVYSLSLGYRLRF